jgi:hypothetical protein
MTNTETIAGDYNIALKFIALSENIKVSSNTEVINGSLLGNTTSTSNTAICLKNTNKKS